MTVQQTNWIKTNLFNISTLLSVLTFIIYQARWQEHVDAHINDKTLHMSFDRKIEVFVPRVELDGRIRGLELQQNENNAKLDKILDILLKNK